MKKCLKLFIGIFLPSLSFAQNPALSEEEPQCKVEYTGEYEWYVYQDHFKWFDSIYDIVGSKLRTGPWGSGGKDYILSYEIEVVGFPFIPDLPSHFPPQVSTADREFKVPNSNLLNGDVFENVYSGITADLSTCTPGILDFNLLPIWRHNKRAIENLGPDMVDGDFPKEHGKVNWEAFGPGYNSALASIFFKVRCLGPELNRRIYFPHTALKHTINFHCGNSITDPIVESISFVVDHTWENPEYPWVDFNFSEASQAVQYDIDFSVSVAEIAPHSSNLSGFNEVISLDGNPYWTTFKTCDDPANCDCGCVAYYCDSEIQSLDYFPYRYNSGTCGDLNHDPSNQYPEEFPFEQGVNPRSYISFSPTTLVFYQGTWMEENRWSATNTNGLPHKYILDNPFDVSVINPNEKVIYNPREIELTSNIELVFPSEYIFKTPVKIIPELFNYPSDAEIQQALSELSIFNLEFNSVLDIPFNARQQSRYIIKNGSSVKIEDCVQVYDLEFIDDGGSGAVVEFNSDNLIYRGVSPIPQHGGIYVDRVQSMTCDQRTNIPCAYTFEENHEITSNIDWTNKKYSFFKKLIVKNGATLTLNNSTLKFSNFDATGVVSRLEIEPGGKVVMENGSELTSYLDCGFWEGVFVYGDPFADQQTSSQGEIRITEGSKITHAEIAINSGESLYGGGIIWCDGAEFTNNLLDIKIGEYNYATSATKIMNSTFTPGQPLQTFGSQKSSFIEVYKHSDPLISGNTIFGQSIETGIINFGGEIQISDNTLNSLLLGIKAQSYGGSNPQSHISGNSIISNYVSGSGISASNGNNDFISGNTISLGYYNSFENFGIKSSNPNGGNIANNTISCTNGTETTGILVSNSSELNSVHKNDIDGFSIGIRLSGNGAMVSCNELSNYEIGISVTSSGTWPDIGSSNEDWMNEFLGNCVTQNSTDIQFSLNPSPIAEYFWSSGNPNPPTFSCVSPTSVLKTASGEFDCSGSGGGGGETE